MKIQANLMPLFGLQRPRNSARNAACVAVLALSAISAALAQQPAQTPSQPTATESAKVQPAAAAPAPTTTPASPENVKPTTPQTPQEKQLADDTAKLLTLANELKKEMDKSSKDTLSLSVVKKAEQVEKLAHKVRDEMKESLVN